MSCYSENIFGGNADFFSSKEILFIKNKYITQTDGYQFVLVQNEQYNFLV